MGVIICVVCGRALTRAVPCLVTKLSALEAKTFWCCGLIREVSRLPAVVALQCLGSVFLKVLPFPSSAGEERLALLVGHVV